MHSIPARSGVLAHAAVILALTGGAEAATLTSATRSVDAATGWKFRWDTGPFHTDEASVGPIAGFGLFDESVDADTRNTPITSPYSRLISSQTSTITPNQVSVDMSLEASSAGFGGTYDGGFDGRSFFRLEFTLDAPTDVVFDASVPLGFLQTPIDGRVLFTRIGGGFHLESYTEIFGAFALHHAGQLPAGDYVIEAELFYVFNTYPGYMPNLSTSNTLDLSLSMVPAPGAVGLGLCAGVLGLRRRRG